MLASKPFKFRAPGFADMSRRAAVTGAALAVMALSGCTDVSKPAEGDMTLGADEGAKVVVIEYASVTCLHCAEWQRETWPAFKAKYVQTKRIRYVFREFPTDPVPVAAAGFMVARCAGPQKYFDLIHSIMASQDELFGGQPVRDVLLRIAQQQGGLTEAQFETCLKDKAATEALDKRIKAGIDAGVTGTPTFFVNGEKVINPNLTNLSAAIDAALAK